MESAKTFKIVRTSESAGKVETAVATKTAETAESMDVSDEDNFSLILCYHEPPVKDAVFRLSAPNSLWIKHHDWAYALQPPRPYQHRPQVRRERGLGYLEEKINAHNSMSRFVGWSVGWSNIATITYSKISKMLWLLMSEVNCFEMV